MGTALWFCLLSVPGLQQEKRKSSKMMKTTIMLAAGLVVMMAVSTNALFWPAPADEEFVEYYDDYDEFRRESPAAAPKNIFDIIFGFLKPGAAKKRIGRSAPLAYAAAKAAKASAVPAADKRPYWG